MNRHDIAATWQRAKAAGPIFWIGILCALTWAYDEHIARAPKDVVTYDAVKTFGWLILSRLART